MGLDTYPSRTAEDQVLSTADVTAFQNAKIDLCGGDYSDGVTSIRGKLYADLVLDITGISLYQHWITPEEVLSMANALNAHSADQLPAFWDSLDGHHGPAHSSRETADLKGFFGVCADRGLGLIGWW